MNTYIFISHRHQEKSIANVIKKHLKDWGVPRNLIFQSSDAKQSTVIGEQLTSELVKAASNAKLLILIYTHPELDWSFCFYEIGVATKPGTPDTRLVVLQCTDSEPAVCKDLVRVKLTEEEILKFTTQFHKEPGFVLKDNEVFGRDVDDETVQARSKRLHDDLRKVVPARGRREIYRWDFMTLRLENDTISELKKIKTGTPSPAQLKQIENNLIILNSFGEAAKHFDFQNIQKGQRFSELLERWRETLPNSPDAWVNELFTEIFRIIHDIPAKPGLTYLMSAIHQANSWLYPVVNHARVLPENKIEFDIYFYKVPGPTLDIRPADKGLKGKELKEKIGQST